MATVIALLAVLSLVPLLGVLLIRKEASFAVKRQGRRHRRRTLCAASARWIALRMVSHPGLYSLIGLLVVVGLSFIYANLEPRYRLADQVPDKQQAVEAIEPARRQAHRRQSDRRADRVPEGRDPLRRRDARDHRRGAHDRREAGRRRQRLVARTRCGAGSPRRPARPIVGDAQAICRHPAGASDAPLHLGRARTPSWCRAAFPTSTRASFCRWSNKLDKALDDVRKAHPGYEIAVTGLSAIAARNSADMIGKLNRGADGRDRLRRGLHRPRLPLVRRDAGRASCRASSRW